MTHMIPGFRLLAAMAFVAGTTFLVAGCVIREDRGGGADFEREYHHDGRGGEHEGERERDRGEYEHRLH